MVTHRQTGSTRKGECGILRQSSCGILAAEVLRLTIHLARIKRNQIGATDPVLTMRDLIKAGSGEGQWS